MLKQLTLTSHFSQTNLILNTEDARSLAENNLIKEKKRYRIIIPRSICYYVSFSLAEHIGRNHPELIERKIAQKVPFKSYDAYVVVKKNNIHIWIWNKIVEHKNNLNFIPETLFFNPLKDGIRLVQCIDGVEGQIWNDSILQASHWWKNNPNIKQWNTFLRENGVFSKIGIPTIEKIQIANSPWGKNFYHKKSISKKIIILTLILISSLFSWQIISILKIKKEIYAIQNDNEILSSSIMPIIDARNKVIADIEAINDLNSLNKYPPHSILFYEINKFLLAGMIIENWTYDSGILKITIYYKNKNLEPTTFISNFSQSKILSDIRIEQIREERIFLSFKVTEYHEELLLQI